jgi:hypothetical protein
MLFAIDGVHTTSADCSCFECQEQVAQAVDAIINNQEPHDLSLAVFQQVE